MVVNKNQDQAFSIEVIRYTCADWKWLSCFGVILMLLGSLAIITSVLTTYATVIAIGIFLVIGGFVQAFEALRSRFHGHFFFHIVFGILNIVTGLIMTFKPTIGAMSLTLVIAASFIASGLLRIAALLAFKPHHWLWIFLSALLSFILGIVIFANWPVISLWLVGMFIGVDFIFSGWWFMLQGWHIKQTLCKK